MSSVTIFEQEKTERAESGNNRPLCFLCSSCSKLVVIFCRSGCVWRNSDLIVGTGSFQTSSDKARPTEIRCRTLTCSVKLVYDAVQKCRQTFCSGLGVRSEMQHVFHAFRAFEDRR